MFAILTPGHPAVSFTVWAGAGEIKAPTAFTHATLHVTGDTGAIVKAVLWDGAGKSVTKIVSLTTGRKSFVDVRSAAVVSLQRADKNAAAGASARLVNW